MFTNRMKPRYPLALVLCLAFLAAAPSASGQDFIDHGPSRYGQDTSPALAAPPAGGGLSSRAANPDIEYLVQELDQSLVTGYLEDIVGFGTRYTGTPGCTNAGQYIFDQFKSMGLDVRYHYWSYWGYSDRNVEATLHDSDGSDDEIYIVCAHYDTVSNCPGADDNGSGTAAVLALADLLSRCSFNATLRFVTFSGEEQGLLGSAVYADDCRDNGDNIVGVLNADMIGYATTPDTKDKMKVYYDSPSTWLLNATTAAAQNYNAQIGLSIVPSGSSGGSDHASFWYEGYHAVFYHEYKFNDYYHSSQDTIAHMDLNYFMRCSRLFLATFCEIAGPPVLEPLPDIEIDGQDGPLTIPSSQTIAMTISLDPLNQAGIAHDWWIGGIKNNTSLFCWVYPSGWQSVVYPVRAYNGPLVGLNDFPITTGKIPAGSWKFIFAVDQLNNSYEGTYADLIEVTSY